MKAELETGREAGREAGPGQIAIGTIWLAGVVLVTALVSPALALAEPISGAGAPSSSAPAADTPAALVHVEAARKLAGDDLKTPLFLCRPDSTAVVRQNLDSGSKQWLEPTKVFDNLSYVGNRFVGVWILRTSDGLILFDSSSSADEAEHHWSRASGSSGSIPPASRWWW